MRRNDYVSRPRARIFSRSVLLTTLPMPRPDRSTWRRQRPDPQLWPLLGCRPMAAFGCRLRSAAARAESHRHVHARAAAALRARRRGSRLCPPSSSLQRLHVGADDAFDLVDLRGIVQRIIVYPRLCAPRARACCTYPRSASTATSTPMRERYRKQSATVLDGVVT